MSQRTVGRPAAAAGGALRALVVNVAGCAVLGAVAAGVGAVVVTGDAVFGGFGIAFGALFGSYAGLGLGAAHAVVQAVVLLAVRPERRRPVSPLAATALSVAVAVVAVVWLANDPNTDGPALTVGAATAAGYAALTWPAANNLFPPGRPRPRRSG